jgi:hypothetical protein
MADILSLHKRDSTILNMRNYINAMEKRLADLEVAKSQLENAPPANQNIIYSLNEGTLILNPKDGDKIESDFTQVIGKSAKKGNGLFILSASNSAVTIAGLGEFNMPMPDLITANIHSYHEKSPDLLFQVAISKPNTTETGLSQNWQTIIAGDKHDAIIFPDKTIAEPWSLVLAIKTADEKLLADYAWCVFKEISLVWNNAETGSRVVTIV